jgi:hypothetical protein
MRRFGLMAIILNMFLLAAAAVKAEPADNTDKEAAADTDSGLVGTDSGTAAGEKAASQSQVAASAAPVPPGASKPAGIMDKGTYTVRLKDLEDRVNRLKEQIFRSKARLSLLAETVLDRKIAGAKAVISFRNEMGGSFRLNKATFLLDGGPIFNKGSNSGDILEQKEINLFDGPVMPGDHTLSVVLHYKGHGYGIFSYLKGYAFKTRSSYTFTVGEGKLLNLQIVGFEKGGVTTPLEERPAIRYVEELSDYEESTVKND